MLKLLKFGHSQLRLGSSLAIELPVNEYLTLEVDTTMRVKVGFPLESQDAVSVYIGASARVHFSCRK